MTLYINCCVRKESRTNRLAKVVLQKLVGKTKSPHRIDRAGRFQRQDV